MRGWPFDTVLVANRGEIAVRVLRTVKALGLRGLVLHHAADYAAPALALADGVITIEGATPVAAFLDGAQIIAKALAEGARAIHPGYGFLSENAGFCRAVADAGLVFIGPTADAMCTCAGCAAADQAGGRRRRQGYAHCARSGRIGYGAGAGAARGRALFR